MWKRPCRRRKTACYKRNSQNQKTRSIGERINRSAMTEIGESVRIFWKNPSTGNVNLIAVV